METKERRTKVVIGVLSLVGLLSVWTLATAGDLEPSGPPAPTMKTLDEVEPRMPIHASDLPLTITESGSYYLVEDITFASTSYNAITVECNDVTIDLMGYTLKGPDSGSTCGVYMSSRSNVEIRNGTIRDFGYPAVFEGNASGNSHRVINVRALSNGYGIYLGGYGHLIKDCTAAENTNYGIAVSEAGCTVTDNTCHNNGSAGIYTGGSGTIVTGNNCYDNSSFGISISSSTSNSCMATGNICYSNDNHGLYVTSSSTTVTDNTCCNNTYNGIYAISGCTVTGNTCNNNMSDGIEVKSNNTVTDNICSDNDIAGIHVYLGGNNRVERNHVNTNDCGIDVDTANNLVVKNSAANNTTEYDIVGGNKVGTISTDPTTAGPWDNFDL